MAEKFRRPANADYNLEDTIPSNLVWGSVHWTLELGLGFDSGANLHLSFDLSEPIQHHKVEVICSLCVCCEV